MSARITLLAALVAATALSGCVETSGGYYDDGYRGPPYNDGYRGPVVIDRVGPGPRRDYYRDRRVPDREWQGRDRRGAERRDDRDDRRQDRRGRPERVEARRAEERPAAVEQAVARPEVTGRFQGGRRPDRTLECDPASTKCDGIERLQ